ncbi:MAG: hypothetical protein FWH33_05680 [Oscillospiraceae bacterium]|nr:hypothetical protein [Oscillospiraceae bacterium]
MRTSAITMPFLALLAGAAGCYLRLKELWNVFDAMTGLPQRGATITYSLIGLCAAFLLIMFIFTLISGLKYKSPKGFEHAYGAEALAYPLVFFIIGIAWLGASVKYFLDMNADGILPRSELVFAILSALSAVSMSLFAIEVYQDPRRRAKLALSLVPSLFMCYWLIILYRNNASNPVLLSYCYQCLAVLASTLGFYFTSSYAYNKPAYCKTVFSYFAAIFFCFITLADDHDIGTKLIFVALIAINVIHSSMLIRNLEKKAH